MSCMPRSIFGWWFVSLVFFGGISATFSYLFYFCIVLYQLLFVGSHQPNNNQKLSECSLRFSLYVVSTIWTVAYWMHLDVNRAWGWSQRKTQNWKWTHSKCTAHRIWEMLCYVLPYMRSYCIRRARARECLCVRVYWRSLFSFVYCYQYYIWFF